jgi:hypothetical protein
MSVCADDIRLGMLNWVCPENGEPMTHRGTLESLYYDFEAEGYYSRPWTISQFNDAMVEIHQDAASVGLYINYVGPGRHSVLIPVLDKHGKSRMVKPNEITRIAASGGFNPFWSCEGVNGEWVEHKRTGDVIQVCGSPVKLNGYLHVVKTVDDAAERRLLVYSGVGLNPIQEYRRLQGELAWQAFIDKLHNGMYQQREISADAYQALGQRKKARDRRNDAAAIDAARRLTQGVVATDQSELAAVRRTLSWMDSLVLNGPPTGP